MNEFCEVLTCCERCFIQFLTKRRDTAKSMLNFKNIGVVYKAHTSVLVLFTESKLNYYGRKQELSSSIRGSYW